MEYNLSYSLDGDTLIQYPHNPLTGNSDPIYEQKNTLQSSIIAKYLRFTPTVWYGRKVMKMGATGLS